MIARRRRRPGGHDDMGGWGRHEGERVPTDGVCCLHTAWPGGGKGCVPP